ncbi:MAG TPA: DNA polymerase III subunit alpha [Actinomycetota bacterium]|nr:DNA polymerase III subunit alpha [Actinomycetota bacterium]
MSFVHLHCHSMWSLLDGTMPAEALPHIAAACGMEAVALTDCDSLLGAVRFAKECRVVGIKPIYGAELTIESSRTASDSGNHPPSPEPSGLGRESVHRSYSVTVIARDQTGYANLCRLISDAHLKHERGKPRTSWSALARAEGLFVLSGNERGELARLAAAGDMQGAVQTARRSRAKFGDAYRIEVFNHRGYGHRQLRDRLLFIASDTGIPAVATNDVHYALPNEAAAHEVLHAIGEIVPLTAAQRLRKTSEYYFKDPAEMQALFADAPDLLAETLRIADACDFDLDLGRFHFPEIPIPRGESATGLLARRCYQGLDRRYPVITRTIEDRLQHELQMIFKLGFAAYFLLVADIVEHTKKVLNIRCACRGSAAGSLVCYALGISDVDPVRYDLLFERFMNTRREELPDIDIDVESHRREDVLDHILSTYGAEQTAMCCMVDTFRARMAIRDVGKAIGLPASEIDVVAKAFPRIGASAIPAAVERLPELQGSNLRAGQLEQLFELCLALDRLPRHLALHPSGVVLSSPDLADRVPMQESFGGFTMLQADKDDVEELGLVKLDILGVRMLSAITHAGAEITRQGVELDLDSLPHDDATTFELIRSSRTLGCFQIESPGQRELLARFAPNRFEDLIVDISLFRPGPVKSDMVSPYLDRRHGFADVRYAHPTLKPILAETHGVVVFHEQVIRVIAAVTGCSLDDADFVRRHLDAERPAAPGDPNDSAHSDRPLLGEEWRRNPRVHFHGVAGPIEIVPPEQDVASWFISSAIANGFRPHQAETLWKEVFAFASFGFCKSHAAAFALPTYLSAWLKAHYPAEFLAGVLTHEPGMYPRRLIVADARQFGIPILPVDVNASDAVYRSEPTGASRGIRMSLADVRGISEAEVRSILEARAEAPFTSLEDLWRRTTLSRPVLENLVHVGALESIESRSRRELLWTVAALAESPMRPAQPGEQLQLMLDETITPQLPALPDYTPLDETEAELEVTGIDARRHIMKLYEPLLAELGCTPAARLGECRNDSEVWVAGVKVSSQTPAIRSGQRIIFLTLDDPSGPIDVTIFERVQPRCARTVFHSWLQVVKGVVRKRGGASRFHPTDPGNVGITVVAEEVFDLAELAAAREGGASLTVALEQQRRRQSASSSSNSPRKLWHSSGGSAGR